MASGIFLFITTILFVGWAQAAKAWQRSSARNEMVTIAQTVFRGIERELEDSSALGVETSSTPVQALGFPSVYGVRGAADAGSFQVDPDGASVYRKYIVYYRDASDKKLLRSEVPIPPGHSTERTPLKISLVDLGFGMEPLDFYATGGRPVGSGVEGLSVRREGRVLSLSLELSTSDGRSETYTSSTFLRN